MLVPAGNHHQCGIQFGFVDLHGYFAQRAHALAAADQQDNHFILRPAQFFTQFLLAGRRAREAVRHRQADHAQFFRVDAGTDGVLAGLFGGHNDQVGLIVEPGGMGGDQVGHHGDVRGIVALLAFGAQEGGVDERVHGNNHVTGMLAVQLVHIQTNVGP